MSEGWREIPGWPGYEVSDLGNVRSWIRRGSKGGRDDSPRLLRLGTRGPYAVIQLSRGGAVTSRGVHQLVAEAFVGPRPAGAVACHNNGDPRDNRPANVRWASQKENVADKAVHGTRQIGERHPHAKLSAPVVSAVRMARREGGSIASVAAQFGISRSHVYNICTRRLWAHLED